jgi:hypothetical protein
MAAFQASKSLGMIGLIAFVFLAPFVRAQAPYMKATVERSDARAYLIAARTALENGEWARAEYMAGQAERAMIGISWLRGPWADTPAKIRQDIYRLKHSLPAADSPIFRQAKNAEEDGPPLPPIIQESRTTARPGKNREGDNLGPLVSYLQSQLRECSGESYQGHQADQLLVCAGDLCLRGNYRLAGDLSKKAAASRQPTIRELCDASRQLLKEIRQALQPANPSAVASPIVSANPPEAPDVSIKMPPPWVAVAENKLSVPSQGTDGLVQAKVAEVIPVIGTIEEESEAPVPPRKSANTSPIWLFLGGLAAILMIGVYRFGKKLRPRPVAAKNSHEAPPEQPETTLKVSSILIVGQHFSVDNQ